MSRIYDREKLRAELAGKAMAALVVEREKVGPHEGCRRFPNLAAEAVMAADALLAELDRTEEDPIKAGGTE